MSYKDLKSFQQASVIYDCTVEFCRRYVDRSDRSYRSDRMAGQMEQAARSGKQNIAEGCTQSKNKPKSEHYLLSIASASFQELLEDYEDFLRQRGLMQWNKDDPRAIEVRRIPYGADKSYTSYRSYMDDPERAANVMICLINQTTYLLDQQIRVVGHQMEEKGISGESHGQKLRRIMQEDKKKDEEFDACLQKVVDDAKNRSHKTDMTDTSYTTYTSDGSDSDKAQRGFITKRALLVGGLVMLLLGGFAVMHRSYTSYRSNTSYKSDTPSVFSSSASPVILLGISVAQAQELPQGIALIESNINIIGPRGERINEKVNLNLKPQDNGEYGLVMNPKDEQSFTPGKYSLSANIQTKSGIRHIEQDFLWGVLAINPNKSVYRSGETANLALAVLDERGMMVCDAEVTLQVRKSESQKVTNLSTNDGSIRVNEECYQKKITERPDYETEYQVSDPGIYQMTLTATTKNGTYTIEDWFEVVDRSDKTNGSDTSFFDIERITATRIYPVYEYPVIIKVTPEQDFKGTVTEVVPEFFGIKENRSDKTDTSYMTYRTYMSDKADKTDTSDTTQVIEWTVDWKANQTYELSYSYKSPEISPQFYLLGPLVLRQAQDDNRSNVSDTTYTEPRQWQVAVDAIAVVDTGTTSGAEDLSITNVTVSGSNTLLLVGVGSAGTSGTVNSVTWDAAGANEALTLVGSENQGSGKAQIWIYKKVGPTAGTNKTVTVDFAASGSHFGGAITFTGVDQATPLGTFASNKSASGSPTVDVTSATGELVFDSAAVEDDSAITVHASQSQQWNISGTHSFGGSTEDGAGTVTMSWTGSNHEWATGGVSVKPASENSTPTITSASDAPDPTNISRSVSFVTDWNDADSGEVVKTKICKTNSLTSQNCDGGSWASSSAFTTSDPISLVYDIVGGDAGQTRSYYAFVCDDGGSCSTTVDGTTNGTFVVNLLSTVPNIKTRGASGSGPGTVNIR